MPARARTGAAATELPTSPSSPVPDARASATARRIASGSGGPASARRSSRLSTHRGIDAAGGTAPRSPDSSRWVCALTSAGRIAACPRSATGPGPPPAAPDPVPTMRPSHTSTHPRRTGGATIGNTQSAL